MTRKRIHPDRKTAERLIRVARSASLSERFDNHDARAIRAIMRALKMARQQGQKGDEASGS